MASKSWMAARSFVRCFRNEIPPSNIQRLSEMQKDVLYQVLDFAGFETSENFLFGLVGNEERQKINFYFPFKVIDQKGEVQKIPSGWLNDLFLVTFKIHDQDTVQQKARFVSEAIRESVPLQPIEFSNACDYIYEIPPIPVAGDYFSLVHTKDNDEMSDYAGIHVSIAKPCDGKMVFGFYDQGINKLECNRCGIRLLFPDSIKTYGDLRKSKPSAAFESS